MSGALTGARRTFKCTYAQRPPPSVPPFLASHPAPCFMQVSGTSNHRPPSLILPAPLATFTAQKNSSSSGQAPRSLNRPLTLRPCGRRSCPDCPARPGQGAHRQCHLAWPAQQTGPGTCTVCVCSGNSAALCLSRCSPVLCHCHQEYPGTSNCCLMVSGHACDGCSWRCTGIQHAHVQVAA